MEPRSSSFLSQFLLLSVISGITIGMGRIVTTLYAVHIGADAVEVGLISSVEALGRLLMTLPAGFLVAAYGVQRIYFIANLGPMLLSLVIPWLGSWTSVALVRGLTSLCIPFRIVSMNSAFLTRLPSLGAHKAGWYRAAQTIGMGLLGPALASFFTEHTGFLICYGVIGLLFGAMAAYGKRVLPESEPQDVQPVAATGGMLSQVIHLLRNRDIRESCLIELAINSTLALFQTYIILVTLELRHLNEHHGVLLILVQSLSLVAALFCFGYLAQRLPRALAFVVSLAATALGLACLGVANDLWVLGLGTILISIGAALIHLQKMAQLSALKMSMSKVSSLFTLATIGGALFGASLGALLSQWLELQQLFLVWIPILLVIAAFCRESLRWRPEMPP